MHNPISVSEYLKNTDYTDQKNLKTTFIRFVSLVTAAKIIKPTNLRRKTNKNKTSCVQSIGNANLIFSYSSI